MRCFSSVLLFSASAFLSGCSSFGGSLFPPTPKWPFESHPCEEQICTEAHGVKAFMSASSFCRSVHNFYENTGNRSKAAQVGVGLFGAFAGSVGAQVANGSAVKAWSGLSGVSNALQTSLDETFSAAVSLNRQAAVHDAATKYLKQALIQSSPTKKVDLAIAMALECSIAAAKADAKSLQAISQSSENNNLQQQDASAPTPGN